MGIYSSNRSKSMTISQIPANENYTDHDFGRILYESVQNDQIIFEAMMQNDFNELNAIKEGTLLESELAALNEENKEGFFKTLWNRIQQFFAKIKGAFTSALQKISVYVLKTGKSTVKLYDETVKGKTLESFDVGRYPKFGIKAKLPTIDHIESTINNHKNDDKINSGTLQGMYLNGIFNDYNFTDKTMSNSEFKKAMLEKAFEQKTVGPAEIEELKKIISDASGMTKGIHEDQKNIEEQIKGLEKRLKGDNKDDAKNIAKLVSVVEGVVTAVSSVNVSIVKNQATAAITIIRAAIKKLNGNKESTPKDESALLMEAAIETETEYEEIDNNIPDEIEDNQEVEDIE